MMQTCYALQVVKEGTELKYVTKETSNVLQK